MHYEARFVIDTHGHITTLYKPKGEPEGFWSGLPAAPDEGEVVPYDNSALCLYDMERYQDALTVFEKLGQAGEIAEDRSPVHSPTVERGVGIEEADDLVAGCLQEDVQHDPAVTASADNHASPCTLAGCSHMGLIGRLKRRLDFFPPRFAAVSQKNSSAAMDVRGPGTPGWIR